MEEDLGKKSDRNLKILFYSLALCLIGFIVFLILDQKTVPGTYNYGDFEIRQMIDPNTQAVTYQIKMYVTTDTQTDKPVYVYTRYEPQQVKDIVVEGKPFDEVRNKNQFYLTINPHDNLTGLTTLAMLEIDKFIDNKYLYNKPVNSAFTEEYINWTVKTCDDVNETDSVIWFRLGEGTKIIEENGCIILQGETEEDLVKLADALIFYSLGIVK